ncbi:MAG: hypothetical protein ACLP2Y_03310 [Limisphaerales bacterium]
MNNGKKWPYHMTRRQFLRNYGIASGAITLSPFFIDRFATVCEAASSLTQVYKVMNAPDSLTTCSQNITQLWQMLDGPAKFINPTDVVVIKGNAQWPNQGYTHTGCIKAVIDAVLAIPGFSGEILICDNIQGGGGGAGTYGFDVPVSSRINNWPTYNWNQLAASYQSAGKPVATVQWQNDINWRTPPSPLPGWSTWNPANGVPSTGTAWSRYFLNYSGRNTYISYPIFPSPITAGRLIDMQNGVWENGGYSGRKVKAIFMPPLNNHDYTNSGVQDYAGVTSAVKMFYGATEIFHGSPSYISDGYIWNNYYNIHGNSFSLWPNDPQAAWYAGQLVGTFINNLYSPVLYITAAIYSGWKDRIDTNGAAYTNTVLACTNPVSLDYISCRDVISKVGSPPPTWLDPSTQNNNTWLQLSGCNSQGIGTVNPAQIEVVTYDFNHPTASRLDVDRKIRDFKAGTATEQDVKNIINLYMESE